MQPEIRNYAIIWFVLSLCLLEKSLATDSLIAEQKQPETSTIKGSSNQIDRHALVSRHNVTLNKPDPLTPLSVGNGRFAFTADITGLQTFDNFHQQGMPLCTQSEWGWHTSPNPKGYKMSDVLEYYDVAGQKVPYASDGNFSGGYSPAATWLRIH